MRHIAQAVADASAALALNPNSLRALRCRGAIFAEESNWQSAVLDLAAAQSFDFDEATEALLRTATARLEEEKKAALEAAAAAAAPVTKKAPRFRTALGYATETFREKYISREIKAKRLPENAHRIAALVSLDAPLDNTTPLRFWQLFSVLGEKKIVAIVRNFYERVFSDDEVPASVFGCWGHRALHLDAVVNVVRRHGRGSLLPRGELPT